MAGAAVAVVTTGIPASASASASAVPPIVPAVRSALRSAGDPERAVGQQRYMKSALPYHGLTSSDLRGLLRPLLADPGLAPATRGEWESAVRALWDGVEYREEWYAAIALTGHRAARAWQDPDALGLYRHLVETGAWWDVVDAVAADRVGPILLSHRPVVTPAMRADAVDGHLWVRRTAILAQLKHRSATDVGLLEDVLDANLEDSRFGREFFIRKAVGWALRQYARTDPEWVRGYVGSRGARLSGLSRREALKHL
ncbi:DNA alkylation repair protein [Fodinibacter luteus]|uniref:DNA alkylation repair protein n=1 Tax=Fodinibacter luteus TaxID=552064 RepID=UPI0031E6E20C